VWNDRRLVRRAARGDKDAFATIFRRYEQDLYRYCVAIVGDRQDAQDALQNTMVKALRALPGERREIELKPWLYRVAHNESIELRRRARPNEPLAEELGPPVASLEETAAERVRLRDLLADIAELSERHRGALVMRELGGLDFDEIGAALDTSPAAARQVLYEARQSLQQMSDGREMRCGTVTALLSDRDGRAARRRDVRAHLRDCSECRRFAEGIRGRSETLAGIAPLPAIAAAALLKGAPAGFASGGAAAGGGASGGMLGVTGGAAKVASTGAVLKSAAAIVAVLAVGGAVAVDQGHLLRDGGSPSSETGGGAPLTRGGGEGPHTGAPGASAGGHLAASVADESPGAFKPSGIDEVGLKPPISHATKTSVAAHPDASAARPVSTAPDTDMPAPPGNSGNAPGASKAGAGPSHADHPEHPTHPAHPTHPSNPAKPANPPHPEHPSHPQTSGHAAKVGAAASRGTDASAEAEETPAAEPKSVETREHPVHPTTPVEEASADESAEAAGPTGKPTEPRSLVRAGPSVDVFGPMPTKNVH
jgi:RNA polymerase sigma factor (sigma-70 family)